MDRNWQQSAPGSPYGQAVYAASGPVEGQSGRDLDSAWGSSAATAAPPAPPRPPTPPTPPQPPQAPKASVVPTGPELALPRPSPSKRRSSVIAPWRLRGREARRQMLLVAGFVVLAVLAALVVAVSLSNDPAPESASRVPAGPGGPNPFARGDDPVPALTENDSVLPPADAVQLPPDPSVSTTTPAPVQAGNQATSTPTPVSGSAAGSGSGSGSPAPVPPKTVTLVYSATESSITINGNDSPQLHVGDKLVLRRASGESGAVVMAAPDSFVEARNGYDYTFTAMAPGSFSVTIVSGGQSQAVPVSVS